MHGGSEGSEQSFELFSLPGAQQLDRVNSIALPELKRPDSAIRRPAVLAVVQGVTVIEEDEYPAISAHGHDAMIDLAPRLDGASRHDAFAERDVPQYLADLSGGEGRGCVQSSLCMNIAFTLLSRGHKKAVVPSGQKARLTPNSRPDYSDDRSTASVKSSIPQARFVKYAVVAVRPLKKMEPAGSFAGLIGESSPSFGRPD